MAKMHFLLTGIAIDLDHSEVTQITSVMNSGARGAGALATLLAQLGLIGTTPATVAGIAAAANALVKMGANWLNGCNRHRKGIHLFVHWYGRFWCRSQ
jgi:hypothetical protein